MLTRTTKRSGFPPVLSDLYNSPPHSSDQEERALLELLCSSPASGCVCVQAWWYWRGEKKGNSLPAQFLKPWPPSAVSLLPAIWISESSGSCSLHPVRGSSSHPVTVTEPGACIPPGLEPGPHSHF